MSDIGYYCEECGRTFEKPIPYKESHGEQFDMCPYCKGISVVEGGEPDPPYDVVGYCKYCGAEVYNSNLMADYDDLYECPECECLSYADELSEDVLDIKEVE